ncbi:hypothetical protein J6590_103986 [Homalodisca vitripennis]|nr:hypothetical protein J6590_103986 [Homalodisca vitripennis]
MVDCIGHVGCCNSTECSKNLSNALGVQKQNFWINGWIDGPNTLLTGVGAPPLVLKSFTFLNMRKYLWLGQSKLLFF